MLLCCSLNLYCLKCLAGELVDTELLHDAYEANKFYCQPGAESLCWCRNEPGENVKQGEMKQNVWSISCSTSWISNSSSERQWESWLTSEAGWTRAEQWLRKDGVSGGGEPGWISQKHTSEIFNLALINSCLLQAQIELSYMATPLCWGLLHTLREIWFIHLAYCWRWLEHSLESSPVNWFLTIHDSPPRVPYSSDTPANQLKGIAWQLLTSHFI